MSLLDDNFDILDENILKKMILTVIQNSRLHTIRILNNLPWWEKFEFEKCNWDHILKELHKYYIYLNPDRNTLYIYLGKISESLEGEKCGLSSQYILYYEGEKMQNLKQILGL